MKVHSLYRITNNVNGKVYIGYTSGRPSHRFAQHRYNATHKPTKNYSAIHAAFNKYGVDNFTFEVVYQSLDKDHTLAMEVQFIADHNAMTHGYNLIPGGTEGGGMKGKKHSEETKAKMAAARTGRKFSDEAKAKISESNKKPKSAEHVENMRKALTGRTLSAEHRAKLAERTKEYWKKKHGDENHTA